MRNKMRPIHPGEVLREEFVVPLGLSSDALAQVLHVPTEHVNDTLNESRAITADMALRLAHHFKTTAEFWMNMQTTYDLLHARHQP
jgi:addiction module HigA family antidote